MLAYAFHVRVHLFSTSAYVFLVTFVTTGSANFTPFDPGLLLPALLQTPTMVVVLGCTGEELSETFLPLHSMVACFPTSVGGWLIVG